MVSRDSCPSQETLRHFVRGELARISADEAEALVSHVEVCARCAETLHTLRGDDSLVEMPPAPAAILCTSEVPTKPTEEGSGPLADAEVRLLLAPAEGPHEIGRLGPYRVRKVLGVGGMGMVFLAHDPLLKRSLALKTLKPLLAGCADARRRFRREAETAAQITHDHVIPILHVGEEGGVPFLAMPLLAGEALAQRLQRDGRQSTAELLRLGAEMTAGLAAAHKRGVIHCDIKPSNIWLEALPEDDGHTAPRCRAKILDFGLARVVDDATDPAPSGTIAGTPAYMAPEQARGDPVDARSDLFGLGCVLYHMATGAMPFKGGTPMATLRSLELDQPLPPHLGNPEMPRALSDLIMLLLAKDPQQRPASAIAVLQEINAIAAQPSARRLFTGRKLALTALVLLAVLGSVGYWFGPTVLGMMGTQDEPIIQTQQAVDNTAAPKDSATGELSALDSLRRENIPAYELAVAGGGDPEQAPAGLVAILGDSRLKHWGGVHGVVCSPDGQWLVSAGLDRTVRIWDAGTGKQLHVMTGHGGEVQCVALDAKGSLLASASRNGLVKFWDPATAAAKGSITTKHRGQLNWIALSGDGATLATASFDGTVKLWDVATANELFTLGGGQGAVHRVAFRPDGQVLAAAYASGSVKLWDVKSGSLLQNLIVSPSEVWSVVFSPDGDLLAAGNKDGTIHVWDTDTWTQLPTLRGHGEGVHGLAFGADGKMLASASKDHTVRLWDPFQGTELRTLRGHTAAAYSVAFRGGTSVLVSSSLDHSIKLWDTATGQETLQPAGHRSMVDALAFHPSGRVLASGSADHCLKLWDLATSKELHSVEAHDRAIVAVAYSPCGDALASGGRDGVLKLWDPLTWKVRTLKVPQYVISSAAFTPNGRALAFSTGNGKLNVWDVAQWKEVRAVPAHTPDSINRIAISPDGSLLASASPDRTIKLWEVDSGFELHTLHGHRSWVEDLAFRGDGKMLASCGNDRNVKLWDLVAGKEIRNLAGHGEHIHSLAFPRSGTLLASVSNDGTLRFWDTETGATVSAPRLAPRGAVLMRVVFSPDGRHLATANGNGTIYLFRVATATMAR
jgi:WD40 repeat protein